MLTRSTLDAHRSTLNARVAAATMRPLALGALVLMGIGTLSRPAEGQAGRPKSDCEITSSRDGSDTRRAEAACRAVKARYELLFARPAPRGRIRFSDSAGFVNEDRDDWWQIRWRRTAAAERARVPLDWSVLPHEIGHLAFAVGDSVARRPWEGWRYGTQHPDWLDEAVAVWFEPPAERTARLGAARALARSEGGMLALERLLAMPHPGARANDDKAVIVLREDRRNATRCVGAGVCDSAAVRAAVGPRAFDDRVIRYRQYADGREVVDTAYYPAGKAPRQDEVHDFYVLSYATLLFVRELGGQRAFDTMIARLHAGAAPATVLRGLPGLPGDAAGLERRWRAWLAAAPDAAVTREADRVPDDVWSLLPSAQP